MDEDTKTFLMGLTPDQKQSLMRVTNQIFDTLVGYLEHFYNNFLKNVCLHELEDYLCEFPGKRISRDILFRCPSAFYGPAVASCGAYPPARTQAS